jgi:hypothetical protein
MSQHFSEEKMDDNNSENESDQFEIIENNSRSQEFQGPRESDGFTRELVATLFFNFFLNQGHLTHFFTC